MDKKVLCVLSFFRNCEGQQVRRFMEQVCQLQTAYPEFAVRVNAVYGDCVDNTKQCLLGDAEELCVSLQLIEHNHGGPMFGSTERIDRLTALTTLGNVGLDSIDEDVDLVWYVESDLIWSPNTVKTLIDKMNGRDIVIAPLIFAGQNFYDVFCYRKNGARFAPFFPYHSELNHDGTLTEVDSVGSQFVTTGKVARACRMAPGSVLMGFCYSAWEHGYPVYVDASQSTHHPA